MVREFKAANEKNSITSKFHKKRYNICKLLLQACETTLYRTVSMVGVVAEVCFLTSSEYET